MGDERCSCAVEDAHMLCLPLHAGHELAVAFGAMAEARNVHRPGDDLAHVALGPGLVEETVATARSRDTEEQAAGLSIGKMLRIASSGMKASSSAATTSAVRPRALSVAGTTTIRPPSALSSSVWVWRMITGGAGSVARNSTTRRTSSVLWRIHGAVAITVCPCTKRSHSRQATVELLPFCRPVSARQCSSSGSFSGRARARPPAKGRARRSSPGSARSARAERSGSVGTSWDFRIGRRNVKHRRTPPGRAPGPRSP